VSSMNNVQAQIFDHGKWHVHLQQEEGSITDTSTGKTYKITILDPHNFSREVLIACLNQVADHKEVEYHADGKCSFDKLRGGETAVILRVYQTVVLGPTPYPKGMIPLMQNLSEEGLKTAANIYDLAARGGSISDALKSLKLASDRQTMSLLLAPLFGERVLLEDRGVSEEQKREARNAILQYAASLSALAQKIAAGEPLLDGAVEPDRAAFVEALPLQILQELIPKLRKVQDKFEEAIKDAKGNSDKKEAVQDLMLEIKDIQEELLFMENGRNSWGLAKQIRTSHPLLWPLEAQGLILKGEDFAKLENHVQSLRSLISAMEARLANQAKIAEPALLNECASILEELKTADDKTVLHTRLRRSTNALLSKNITREAFAFRIEEAKLLDPPKNHPLYSMTEAIQNQTKLSPAPLWGAYFSHFNTKGGDVNASVRKIEMSDGKIEERCCFFFKLTHVARKELQTSLAKMITDADAFNAVLPKELCEGVKIKFVPQFYRKRSDDVYKTSKGITIESDTLKIEFKGLGTVIIGNDKEYRTLYNCVSVEMAPESRAGDGVRKLNQLLTLAGIGPILLNEDRQVDERIKIAQITRILYPAVISTLDKTTEFYEMPLEELKKAICAKEPEMGDYFEKYYEDSPGLVSQVEIFPGKLTWSVDGFSGQVRVAGGWGLMAGMGGDEPFSEVCGYVVRRLSEGTVSSLDRFMAGWMRSGASSSKDIQSGGGNEAFLRLIGKPLKDVPLHKYPLGGQIQVLYDLSILNRGAYAYNTDLFGTKNPAEYGDRNNLIVFMENLNSQGFENEVMIKSRIPPEFICGVAVDSPEHKEELIKILANKPFVKEGKINGILLKDFVHVLDEDGSFDPSWWPVT
jgi:hypothetical protein